MLYKQWRDCPTVGPDGKPFWVDLRNAQFSWLVYGWRTKAFEKIIVKLPEDGVCIDIGAHIGVVSRRLSACVPNGRVVAFEPSPNSYRQLERNSYVCSNIFPYQIALGRLSGEAYFSDDTTPSVLRHIESGGGANTIRIRVEQFETWVRENHFSRIDLIKIDVEGLEEDILVPAEKMLARFRPVIIFEFYEPFAQARSFYRGEQLFAMFERLDYIVYRIDIDGNFHRNFKTLEAALSSDYLALPK